MARIGIPRTLAFFNYYPFWKVFFEKIGHEVIISPPTTKAILDKGVREAVNDACIPIKIYHGHVADLAQKVDYIFCPRFVSVRKYGDFGSETFCPKFLGLPDMVRQSLDNLPAMLEPRIDLKKGKNELYEVFRDLGLSLGASLAKVKSAFKSATKVQKDYLNLLYQELAPPEAIAMLFNETGQTIAKKNGCDLKIAIVGYPYTLYDPYINAGLLKILQRENVKIYTQDMLSDKTMHKQVKMLPKSMFWYYSNRVMYGALHFMKRKDIDGIIHVTAFACGPDSMVDRLLEIETRRRTELPYLSITIDEHTGEAGVMTRIEAYLDMIRYRRDKG